MGNLFSSAEEKANELKNKASELGSDVAAKGEEGFDKAKGFTESTEQSAEGTFSGGGKRRRKRRKSKKRRKTHRRSRKHRRRTHRRKRKRR